MKLSKFKEAIKAISTYLGKYPEAHKLVSGDRNLTSDTVTYYFDENQQIFPVIEVGKDDKDTAQYQKRERAHLVFNMVHKKNLNLIVIKPTRGNNILDLVFTDMKHYNVDITPVPTLSDHSLV